MGANMKRNVHLVGFLACVAAAAASSATVRPAAKGSGTYVPELGYVTSGGRGLALMLANADGSGGQTAYRYTFGAQYDLTAPSQHLVVVADNHSILMFSWSLSGSTLVTSPPVFVSFAPSKLEPDAVKSAEVV